MQIVYGSKSRYVPGTTTHRSAFVWGGPTCWPSHSPRTTAAARIICCVSSGPVVNGAARLQSTPKAAKMTKLPNQTRQSGCLPRCLARCLARVRCPIEASPASAPVLDGSPEATERQYNDRRLDADRHVGWRSGARDICAEGESCARKKPSNYALSSATPVTTGV